MFVCLNSGLECSSNLQKVIVLTARVCNINSGLMLVGYVLPHTTSPYVRNGYINEWYRLKRISRCTRASAEE